MFQTLFGTKFIDYIMSLYASCHSNLLLFISVPMITPRTCNSPARLPSQTGRGRQHILSIMWTTLLFYILCPVAMQFSFCGIILQIFPLLVGLYSFCCRCFALIKMNHECCMHSSTSLKKKTKLFNKTAGELGLSKPSSKMSHQRTFIHPSALNQYMHEFQFTDEY